MKYGSIERNVDKCKSHSPSRWALVNLNSIANNSMYCHQKLKLVFVSFSWIKLVCAQHLNQFVQVIMIFLVNEMAGFCMKKGIMFSEIVYHMWMKQPPEGLIYEFMGSDTFVEMLARYFSHELGPRMSLETHASSIHILSYSDQWLWGSSIQNEIHQDEVLIYLYI